jgi:threonine aldolase
LDNTTIKKMLDLRSDTVTKPTPEMLAFMFSAEVGDDVYGEDPTVNALEAACARVFGMEAGLFCPSGTMTNQIAIKVLTEPLSEVICDQTAHIYQYEGGGIAFNSGASVSLVAGERGKMTPEQIRAHIRPDNIHFPVTRMVSIENTSNKGGGSYYSLFEIAAISALCREHSLSLHLDGARVFNALVASGDQPADYGKYFDTISVCLSKGLGAPAGSVLLGSQEHIRKARRVRKVLGGAMRQAGYMAAACLYALHHHVERLTEDHEKAQRLFKALQKSKYVKEILPVETNIVIFRLEDFLPAASFVAQLQAKNIKASSFSPQWVRFVTHLDIPLNQMDYLVHALETISYTPTAEWKTAGV